MKNYLLPLGIFVLGQLCLGGLMVFLPAIGDAATPLTANATYNSTFWGWSWIAGGTKIWMVIIGEFLVLLAALITFLKTRHS